MSWLNTFIDTAAKYIRNGFIVVSVNYIMGGINDGRQRIILVRLGGGNFRRGDCGAA